MLSYYCLKCRKTKNVKFQKWQEKKNGIIMLLSNCVKCDSKRPTFLNFGLLSSLGTKTPWSKIRLVAPLLL